MSLRLIRALLPPEVHVAEMDPRHADPALLLESEVAQVANAVAVRRREFAAGRILARRLMPACGVAPRPLLNGNDRAPQWPRGVVGSITHCRSWAAVAVAETSTTRAIGIDLEPAEPLLDELVSTVCAERELRALGALGGGWKVAESARIVFSAKEATYKALYPEMRTILEFHDMEVALCSAGRDNGVYTATLARDVGPFRAGEEFRGRWRRHAGRLACAIRLTPVAQTTVTTRNTEGAGGGTHRPRESDPVLGPV